MSYNFSESLDGPFGPASICHIDERSHDIHHFLLSSLCIKVKMTARSGTRIYSFSQSHNGCHCYDSVVVEGESPPTIYLAHDTIGN